MRDLLRRKVRSENVVRRYSACEDKKYESAPNSRSRANDILGLQACVGNREVQNMVNSQTIQGKLRIGAPNDKYEQEADRVADEVMRMPGPKIHQKQGWALKRGSSCEDNDSEEEKIQVKPLSEQITPLVQRQEEEEEEEFLQAKAIYDNNRETNLHLEKRFDGLKGTGQPLTGPTRDFFEPRFGYDFSKVRVHADGHATEAAKAVNARVFTLGQKVVFGAGEYVPSTNKGKRLLAHELGHVVQQTRKLPVCQFGLQIAPLYHFNSQIQRTTDQEADVVFFVPPSFEN